MSLHNNLYTMQKATTTVAAVGKQKMDTSPMKLFERKWQMPKLVPQNKGGEWGGGGTTNTKCGYSGRELGEGGRHGGRWGHVIDNKVRYFN